MSLFGTGYVSVAANMVFAVQHASFYSIDGVESVKGV